jgi:hypothetical protein
LYDLVIEQSLAMSIAAYLRRRFQSPQLEHAEYCRLSLKAAGAPHCLNVLRRLANHVSHLSPVSIAIHLTCHGVAAPSDRSIRPLRDEWGWGVVARFADEMQFPNQVPTCFVVCKNLLLTLGQVDEQNRTRRAGQGKTSRKGRDEQDRARRAGQGETSRTGRDEQDRARRAGQAG